MIDSHFHLYLFHDTTYYSDGKIRVHLENLLAKAIGSDAIRFRLKEALDPGMIQHSGVLFVLDEKVSPSLEVGTAAKVNRR